MNLYVYVANDPVNKIDPTGEYGCGSGWGDCATSKSWAKFDKAQQKAASKFESRAAKLDAKAAKLDAKGKTGGDALRSRAESFRGGAKALRSDGSAETGGYVADAVNDPAKADVPAWVPTDDRTRVVVNLAHPDWNSSGKSAQWDIGHESLHSTAGGVFGHQRGPNGAIAYKYGRPEQREAYEALKGTPEAARNPDHLVDEVY